MDKEIFIYGGNHFIPERAFTARDGDFFKISRRLRLDVELGIFNDGYWQGDRKGKISYSQAEFYRAATDKNCDLFRCVENGKLYVPCEHGLQEYMEPKKEKEKGYER